MKMAITSQGERPRTTLSLTAFLWNNVFLLFKVYGTLLRNPSKCLHGICASMFTVRRGAEPPWAGVDGFMESLFSQKRSSLSQMPTADFLYSSTGHNWVMFQLQAMLGEPSATAKTCAPSVLKALSHYTATQNRQTGSTGCPGKHGPYLSASWFNKECQVASHLRSDDSSVLLLLQVSLSSTLRDTC